MTPEPSSGQNAALMDEDTLPLPPETAVPQDPELPAVQAQLVVFARELSELYHLERERSAQLETVLEHLQETYLATMKTLAQVVEAKDLTTKGHLDRTHAFGLTLAERIDPDLARRPELGYGFFLHDIGKVGIPEHILCKRGPLSPEEWNVMRSHPVIGSQIVEPIRFLGDAVEIIRHHHEWFDGSGYPGRLVGEAIPLAARIFALADSYDAMTSDRPYRSALAIDEALEEVKTGAGSQFDPEVVREFMSMMEGEGLAEEHAEQQRAERAALANAS